jgi:hypothetical protein
MTQRLVQIINVALTTATDEYSLQIPAGAVDVQMQMGDATHTAQVYQVSVGNGGSPANYWTILPNRSLSLGQTKQDPQTLYVMPASSSTILQVSYYLDQ